MASLCRLHALDGQIKMAGDTLDKPDRENCPADDDYFDQFGGYALIRLLSD